jgi:hypothetical protein
MSPWLHERKWMALFLSFTWREKEIEMSAIKYQMSKKKLLKSYISIGTIVQS